jgi:pimeloyl-ACP methyl ester carboxylesterase
MERLGGAEARGIARRYWDGEATGEIREAYAPVCLPLYSRRSEQDTDAADRMRRIRWNPEVLEHFRQALAGTFDPWSGLDQVTCPTMILAGEHDPVATASAARRLAAELPGVRLHVLPGAGHGIFREDPERACALLQEFLMGNRVDANARVS